MANLSKLERSNKAHKRLRKKHLELGNKCKPFSDEETKHFVLSEYHEICEDLQSRWSHILTKDQKKSVYKRAKQLYRA